MQGAEQETWGVGLECLPDPGKTMNSEPCNSLKMFPHISGLNPVEGLRTQIGCR